MNQVQEIQLEIAKEIRRICEAEGIPYFLDNATLIGAVRHKGFIPWDDDMDIGMLREEYERFCRVAPERLGARYVLQTWHTDRQYAAPFAKVRKRGTEYVEEKAGDLSQCGVFVDVFPYDNCPATETERQKLYKKLVFLFRLILMKNGYRPWRTGGKTIWKKRLGYLPYQVLACFLPRRFLIGIYEKTVFSHNQQACSGWLYQQTGIPHPATVKARWMEPGDSLPFEDTAFQVPKQTHQRLSHVYGDYMVWPSEARRNRKGGRHGIIRVRLDGASNTQGNQS